MDHAKVFSGIQGWHVRACATNEWAIFPFFFPNSHCGHHLTAAVWVQQWRGHRRILFTEKAEHEGVISGTRYQLGNKFGVTSLDAFHRPLLYFFYTLELYESSARNPVTPGAINGNGCDVISSVGLGWKAGNDGGWEKLARARAKQRTGIALAPLPCSKLFLHRAV